MEGTAMKRTQCLAAVAVAALLAVTVVACSDDDEPAAVRSDASTELTEPTEPTTTATIPATATSTDGAEGSGDGATVSLGGGLVEVPAQDVGDVDLAALPLGSDLDTSSPGVGRSYVCADFGQAPLGGPVDGAPDGGGQDEASWIHGDTFDLTEKLWVAGEVEWPDAEFAVSEDGEQRILAGNTLPVDHHTGTFPVEPDDPAYAYKPDPLAVEAHPYEIAVPADPVVADEASCVGGEVGILLSGVPLFNSLDAEGLDAVAEEVQDTCWGHPNVAAYHYHAVSSCIPDPGTGHSNLVGYAFDGFGIFGHRGVDGEVLTNEDLDECHGHTHEIEWDGETVEMFHYHATWEFPYVVGCYRGTPAVQGPAL